MAKKKNTFSPVRDTSRIKLKVPREEIVFIDMLFKAYEGLAMVTVGRKEKGIIYLDVTEGTKRDVLDIIEDLSKKFYISILEK